MPYMGTKSDLLAIPDFAAGAMVRLLLRSAGIECIMIVVDVNLLGQPLPAINHALPATTVSSHKPVLPYPDVCSFRRRTWAA